MNSAGVKAEGTAEIEIRQSRGQEISVRLTCDRGDWDALGRGGRSKLSFEGDGDGGRVKWSADQVHANADVQSVQRHVSIELFVPELRRAQRAPIKSEPADTEARYTALFSRSRCIPAPPTSGNRTEDGFKPDATPCDVSGDGTAVLKTAYHSLEWSPDVGVGHRDFACLSRVVPLSHSTEINRAGHDFIAMARRVAAALSFLSAEFVEVLAIHTVLRGADEIIETDVFFNAVPVQKRAGSSPVVGYWELHEYLPPIYEALSASGNEAEVLRQAIHQFAGLCSETYVEDRLRFGVVALDILSAHLGSGRLCNKSEARTYRETMLTALADARAPEPVVERARNGLAHVFSRSFKHAIETTIRDLGVSTNDALPDGFDAIVSARNDLQHRGFVSEEVASFEEWIRWPSALSVVVARIILRACGIAPKGHRNCIWGAAFERPGGW